MTEKVPRRAQYGVQRLEAGQDGEAVAIPMQYPRIMGPNAVKYVTEFVESGLTVDMVGRFEKAFAEAHGVKHCIATPGCTPALAALAAGFEFEPGDEVITSPISDYGTIQGLFREGYIPVFADAAPGTVNLSAETIEPLISDRTRAILAVHMTGLVCDMDPINELAASRGLVVYEDCCQATFSEYKGRLAGTLCHAAGFSFDSEKAMGSDVGGAVLTDDDDLAEKVRFHGQSRGGILVDHFGRKHTAPGYAYRMPHCTAAICLAQLEIIREHVEVRDRMVRLVSSLVGEIPGLTPLPIPDYQGVYSAWAFGFTMDPACFDCSAETFAAEMKAAGIPYADIGKMYQMTASSVFLEEWARAGRFPFSQPPASRTYSYTPGSTPAARDYLENWVYWPTICEKYTEEICEAATAIVAGTAERHRK